jgi:hypothetical protein
MKKRLSPGCVIALVLVSVVGLCAAPQVVGVVSMNLQRDDFAAFDHIPTGTPVDEVARRAEAMGFERERVFDAADAGVDHRVYMKTVVPPFGRWFVHITAVDGGVTDVHTSSLD